MLSLGKLDNKSIYYIHEKIDGILQFLSKTIDDFRNFFSPDQAREFLTVESVLSSTLAIIGEGYKTSNIAITIENNSKASILMHKNSLVQVFLNILGNAKQALSSKQIQSAAIAITIDETSDHIIVTICDNAGGIPEGIADKISQPYFTTKGVGGTGLGLYICETIIETYFSGTLRWHNNKQGACFVITLNRI
jgi:C4-dicarboxylate-specific signal transduction histidine kinase